LNQWVARNPIEKIYFHFDRSDYIAGQTIWLKGYVYADFLPASKRYTATMLIHGIDLLYKKTFFIFSKTRKNGAATPVDQAF